MNKSRYVTEEAHHSSATHGCTALNELDESELLKQVNYLTVGFLMSNLGPGDLN